MILIQNKIDILCEKYDFNKKNFKIIIKNFLFFKNIKVLYLPKEYFLNINSFKNFKVKSKFFFPSFYEDFEDDAENWFKSIKITYEKKQKLLKNIIDGKNQRDNFKKKFKI